MKFILAAVALVAATASVSAERPQLNGPALVRIRIDIIIVSWWIASCHTHDMIIHGMI